MKSKNDNFIDRISYILLWISVCVAVIAAIFATVSYITHGGNDYNKGNIATTTRFLIFAILLFGFRKLYIRKN